MIEVISTSQFLPGERLDVWNELIGSTYDGMFVDSASDQFQARLGVWQLDDLRIVRPHSRPASIVRHQRDRTVRSALTYVVHLLTEGRVELEQRGRRSELQPGDMVICAAEEYYRFDAPMTHEMLVVEFKEPQLAARLPNIDDFVARTISGRAPGTRILRRYLSSLWQEARGPLPKGYSRLHENILLELTVACLSDRDAPPSHGSGPLLARMEDAICARLDDPEFGPSGLAKHLDVPLRTLQSAAARSGTTIGALITDLRLRKAAKLLAERPAAHIAEIAWACGFADPGYFARRFQQTYGTSPSGYRAAS